MKETVNHPKHYNTHPSGVECIDIVENLPFNIGNAVKYLWRADHKNGNEDIEKAKWYLKREANREYKDFYIRQFSELGEKIKLVIEYEDSEKTPLSELLTLLLIGYVPGDLTRIVEML